MKIRPLGAEYFHADRMTEEGTDGQTDVNEAFRFRNFGKSTYITNSTVRTKQ